LAFGCFVTRLDPTGSSLLYSTVFARESTYIRAAAIDLDVAGGATIAGTAQGLHFPTTPGAFQRVSLGGSDGFVSRFDLLPRGVEPYGTSTPACQRALAAGVTRIPRSGDGRFAMTCVGAPPLAAGLLAVGVASHHAGIPVAGIQLHLDPHRFLLPVAASSDATGYAVTPWPLPAKTGGSRFFAQFVWWNPPSCQGPGLLSASQGLDVTVQ
jgi:hypothetical protein